MTNKTKKENANRAAKVKKLQLNRETVKDLSVPEGKKIKGGYVQQCTAQESGCTGGFQ